MEKVLQQQEHGLTHGWDMGDNAFSIYLNENDKVYFSSYGTNVASYRHVTAKLRPMF